MNEKSWSVKKTKCPYSGAQGFTLWNCNDYYTDGFFESRTEAVKACKEANSDE